MSTDISQEDHDLAIQELTNKYAAELARSEHMQEAEITKRVAAALAAPSAPASSPLNGKSLFRPIYTSPIRHPLSKSSSAPTPSLAASTSVAPSPQTDLDEALRARAIQQQPQEVAWSKRSLTKATLASVTLLLKDFDIYKRKQGVKSLHECCGVEFLILLEGAMNVTIPDPDDGDDPLRALLVATFEPPETFDSRLKADCKALAMPKGKQASIEDLQTYLSDFYSLIQDFFNRGQIADADDPDFNLTLISYFMANVEPVEMRNKMQEFRVSTFSQALTRFRKYLKPDIIALVNITRAQAYDKRAATDLHPFSKSGEIPRRAARLSNETHRESSSTPAPGIVHEIFDCQNCPGAHKTKNCVQYPCVKCKAAGKPDEHSQRLCPDKGGYPQLPRRANAVHRSLPSPPASPIPPTLPTQPRPITGRLPKPPATHNSLPLQPRPPTPPRSILFHPDSTSYVPPRYKDEDYHFSDGTYEDEEPPSEDGDTVWSDGQTEF